MTLQILFATIGNSGCPVCDGMTRRITTRGCFARRGAVKEHVECARCGIRTLAYKPGEPPAIFGWIKTRKGKR